MFDFPADKCRVILSRENPDYIHAVSANVSCSTSHKYTSSSFRLAAHAGLQTHKGLHHCRGSNGIHC